VITIQDMVEQWLRSNGYTGLYSEECGCEIDDLMPCIGFDEPVPNCNPGYKHKCPPICSECPNDNWCELDREYCSWYISGEE